MSLVRRTQLDFPALMNEIFKPDWFGGVENASGVMPAVNIVEHENRFELALSVPGMRKEDFNVELDKDVLTVSAEVGSKDNEGMYTLKEFTLASFKRSFTLPNMVDAEKIKANYENGILSLVLPKKEEALPKPKRMIKLA